jgi:hypothetical protein
MSAACLSRVIFFAAAGVLGRRSSCGQSAHAARTAVPHAAAAQCERTASPTNVFASSSSKTMLWSSFSARSRSAAVVSETPVPYARNQ